MHRTRLPQPLAPHAAIAAGLQPLSAYIDAGALVLWTTPPGSFRPAPVHPRPTLLLVVTSEIESAER